MRATTPIMQLAHARWTPCVALVFGSLLFVSLAIALIPDRLGPIGPQARAPRAFTPQGAVANEPFQTEQASPIRVGSPTPASPPLPAVSPQQHGINNGLVGSLFGSTPPMELPIAPPDPDPPPPPAELPPPAPTPSIFELPAPPPQAQTPVAATPAPGEPQASEPETNAAQGQ